MMSKIVPVDLELTLVVHMHQFMHNRLLHVLFIRELSLTKDDSAFWAESTRPFSTTGSADEMVRGHIASRVLQVLKHEYNCGT